MIVKNVTVGTTAVQVTVPAGNLSIQSGMAIRQLSADEDAGNTGLVYVGFAGDITAAGGDVHLVPKGAAGAIDPFVVTAKHFADPDAVVYLISDTASQQVDVAYE